MSTGPARRSWGLVGVGLGLVALAALGVAGTLTKKSNAKKPGQVAAKAARPKASRFPRIDAHTHIIPDSVERALEIMQTWGIDGMVNLSGMTPGPPQHALETQLAAARASGGRIAVFASAGFMKALRMANMGLRADYGQAMAEELALSKQLGAIGLKIPKGLGLGYPTPDMKKPLPVDDPGLDPLFEKAGELDMPVSIHTGDPKAFWLPADPKNERWDELQAHPDWSFHGQPVPSWEELYAAFERRVARHPKTIFIGVHFGNDPEDPDRVAAMLDKYPNLYIDTAARVPEIGRQDADKMRLFFEKYQDRILFGTDLGVAAEQDEMMYGSNGSKPPTLQDEARYFTSTWRYFETRDKQFESPTPIQGRWKIDGVGLPDSILRKLYFDNAVKVLKWRPPPGPVTVPTAAPMRGRSASSPASVPRGMNEK